MKDAMSKVKPNGRLAFRAEGTMWSAYWALPDTMDGALLIGSIAMAAVQDVQRKHAFMMLIQDALASVFAEKGIEIDRWSTQSAPEHERGGNA